MYKIIVNEEEFDLLPKLKELVNINIGIIKDNINETDDEDYDVLFDLSVELSLYAAIAGYILDDDIDNIIRIIYENIDTFSMFEIIDAS